MAAILFKGDEPLEQTVNILLKEGSIWYLVKIFQVKKTLKDYMILNIYIAQGQGCITARGQNFRCSWQICNFNNTMEISAINL